MSLITLSNSANAGNSTGTTDLTGYGFTDNPVIANFASREQTPTDGDTSAIPAGSQENFSLVISSGSSQFLEGELAPDGPTVGDSYTVTGWIRPQSTLFGTTTVTAESVEIINARYTSGSPSEGSPSTFRAITAAGDLGFTIGFSNDGADNIYWHVQVNDVEAVGTTALVDPDSTQKWYWFALVKDGNDVDFYFTEPADANDGIFDTSASPEITLAAVGVTNWTSTGQVNIGHDVTKGFIHDAKTMGLQFWNSTVLTATELQAAQYTILVAPQAEISGLTHYYRFNPDFNNIVKDSNFGKNNFYLTNFEGNPFIEDVPSDFGSSVTRSLEFLGNDEYIRRFDNSNNGWATADQPVGSMFNFNSSFTMECWVKFNSLPASGESMGIWSKWLSTGTPANDRGCKLTVLNTAGNTNFRFVLSSGIGATVEDDFVAADIPLDVSAGISTGRWYYIAVVKDMLGIEAGPRYYFYIHDDDDDAEDTGFSAPYPSAPGSGTGTIAAPFGTETYQPTVDMVGGVEQIWNVSAVIDNYFDGRLLMFRGFKTVRTASQIVTNRAKFIEF